MENITHGEQKIYLLSVSIGSQHYNNLVVQLQGKKTIDNLKYPELIECFTQLLTKCKNAIVDHHYFLNVKQKENQNIVQFVADLKEDLSECNFSMTCECTKQISAADLFL